MIVNAIVDSTLLPCVAFMSSLLDACPILLDFDSCRLCCCLFDCGLTLDNGHDAQAHDIVIFIAIAIVIVIILTR